MKYFEKNLEWIHEFYADLELLEMTGETALIEPDVPDFKNSFFAYNSLKRNIVS
jgi:hypothetical protein